VQESASLTGGTVPARPGTVFPRGLTPIWSGVPLAWEATGWTARQILPRPACSSARRL